MLYQEKLHADKIARVIKSKAFFYFKDSADALINKICSRGCAYGLETKCIVPRTLMNVSES